MSAAEPPGAEGDFILVCGAFILAEDCKPGRVSDQCSAVFILQFHGQIVVADRLLAEGDHDLGFAAVLGESEGFAAAEHDLAVDVFCGPDKFPRGVVLRGFQHHAGLLHGFIFREDVAGRDLFRDHGYRCFFQRDGKDVECALHIGIRFVTAVQLFQIFLTRTVEIQIQMPPGRVVIENLAGIQFDRGTVQGNGPALERGSADLLHVGGQFPGPQIQFGMTDLVLADPVWRRRVRTDVRGQDRLFCRIGIQRKDDVCRVIQRRSQTKMDSAGQVVCGASAVVIFTFQCPVALSLTADRNVGGVHRCCHIKGDGADGLNAGLQAEFCIGKGFRPGIGCQIDGRETVAVNRVVTEGNGNGFGVFARFKSDAQQFGKGQFFELFFRFCHRIPELGVPFCSVVFIA